MLSQPTSKITIAVSPTAIVWNGKNCPVLLNTNPNTSHEAFTFFDDQHAQEAKEALDAGKSLNSLYEISPIKGSLFGPDKAHFEAEYADLFLMQVAKVNNRIVGYIDVPKLWLTRADKLTSAIISSPEFTGILAPDIAELEGLIPKIVMRPKVPPTSILKDDDAETDAEDTPSAPVAPATKAKKESAPAKVKEKDITPKVGKKRGRKPKQK